MTVIRDYSMINALCSRNDYCNMVSSVVCHNVNSWPIVITIHQRYRQTDRQTDRRTDGQTTCDRNTALCTKVHRAVKIN